MRWSGWFAVRTSGTDATDDTFGNPTVLPGSGTGARNVAVGAQGKIERWHQTMKNRILLENYYLPGDLEAHIAAFVDHYNHHRYHESLSNLTPADVYTGRGQSVLQRREAIKRKTIEHRRLQRG